MGSCITRVVHDTHGVCTISPLHPGFESVTNSLSWCLMYLVTYPNIQKRIQAELGELTSPILWGWDL